MAPAKTTTVTQAGLSNKQKKPTKAGQEGGRPLGERHAGYDKIPEGRQHPVAGETEKYLAFNNLSVKDLASYLKENAKNGDDVLDRFRECYAVTLAVEEPDRKDTLESIEDAMALYPGVSWKPVRDRVMAWARAGYTGALDKAYFDESGASRSRNNTVDVEFTDVDMGSAVPDAPDLPSDMSWAEERFDRGSPFVTEALNDPQLDKKASCYGSLEAINNELSREAKARGVGLDLSIPINTIAGLLPLCVLEEAKKLRGQGSGSGEQITALKATLLQRGQPVHWSLEVQDTAKLRAKEMLHNPDLASNESWGAALFKWLNDNRDQPSSQGQVAEPKVNIAKATATIRGSKFRKINRLPGQVRYEGAHRPIAALRKVGTGFQVFVERSAASDGSAKVWHILPASRFPKEAVNSYRSLDNVTELNAETKGKYSDIKDIRLDDLEIQGVAYPPIHDKFLYASTPMQFIRGYIASKDLDIWFDFTTLSRRFGREELQETLDEICELAGDLSLAERLKAKKSRVRAPIKLARRRMKKRMVEDEEGEDVEGEPDLVQTEEYEKDSFTVSDSEE